MIKRKLDTIRLIVYLFLSLWLFVDAYATERPVIFYAFIPLILLASLTFPIALDSLSVRFISDLTSLTGVIIFSGGKDTSMFILMPTVIFAYGLNFPNLLRSYNLILCWILGFGVILFDGKSLKITFNNPRWYLDFIFYPSALILLLYFGALLGRRMKSAEDRLLELAKSIDDFINALPLPTFILENDPSQLIKNKAAFQLQIDESALKSQDFVELNGRLYKIYKSMQKTKNCFINRNEPLSIFCLCDITEYKLVNDTYRQESKLKPDFEFDLVASGVIMQKVVHLIKKIAPSNATVLLTGESGTGKSHLACLIHKLSDRADKPFLTVNCGSIPADLLESELFGSVKGAFTGAVDRKGLFLEANGGTVFLDEIGELPPNLQVKLLRVIQDKKVKPLGKNIEIDVDVRLICATNRNLEIAVQNGDFREDLYYRINVVKIVIPPLRDRKEEIPEFIRKFLERKGLSHMKFEPAAIDILMNYDYPGNIRELENILERALIMAEGNLVRKEAIQFNTQVAKPVSIIECDYALPVDLDRLISSLEGTLVRKALKTANFDKNQAAKLLNISTRSLRYRAQKYNLN